MAEKIFLSGLEYLTLLTIIRLEGTGYGVSIHLELTQLTGKNLAYGAVYKVLKNLSGKGLIVPEKGEPTDERGGRAKTFYQITKTGQNTLKEFETNIDRIKHGKKTWNTGEQRDEERRKHQRRSN